MTNENESDEKMPSSLSPTAIKSMTVAELKRHLKRRDLNCQGLKATLAQRLLDFYNTEKDDDDDDDDALTTRKMMRTTTLKALFFVVASFFGPWCVRCASRPGVVGGVRETSFALLVRDADAKEMDR